MSGHRKTFLNLGTSLIFFALFFVLPSERAATPPILEHVETFGSRNDDIPGGIAWDKTGIYCSGAVDVETTIGGVDVPQGGFFVAKLDFTGKLLWVQVPQMISQNIKGAATESSIVADSSGNIYVTLIVFSRFQFGSVIVGTEPGASVFQTLAVVKMDNSGQALWGRNLAETTSGFNINWISGSPVSALDSHGNLFVHAFFDYLAFADGSSFGSDGYSDILLAKIHPDGTLGFLKKFGGPSYDQSAGIYIDREDSVYLCGSFQSVARFGTQVLNGSANLASGFLVKLSNDGETRFAYSRTSTNGVFFRDVSVNTNLEVTVVGYEEIYHSPYPYSNGFGFLLNSNGALQSVIGRIKMYHPRSLQNVPPWRLVV